MADLTYYNKKRTLDTALALREANNIISHYNSKTCCCDCECIIEYNISDTTPRLTLDALHYNIGAILYSSGYWHGIKMTKKHKGYHVYISVHKMTAEEKAEALYVPEAQEDTIAPMD